MKARGVYQLSNPFNESSLMQSPDQTFSIADPHLHSRTAPTSRHAQTDCMSHKSASWKYVACYTHTALSTLNAISLDPHSKKWQLSCSSDAAGQHMGRQLGGLELYRQFADSSLSLAL